MGILDKIFREDSNEYAVVKKVTHGRHKGEFRFLLKGGNNEIVATSETYKNKQDVMDLLCKLFPNFQIVDRTKS